MSPFIPPSDDIIWEDYIIWPVDATTLTQAAAVDRTAASHSFAGPSTVHDPRRLSPPRNARAATSNNTSPASASSALTTPVDYPAHLSPLATATPRSRHASPQVGTYPGPSTLPQASSKRSQSARSVDTPSPGAPHKRIRGGPLTPPFSHHAVAVASPSPPLSPVWDITQEILKLQKVSPGSPRNIPTTLDGLADLDIPNYGSHSGAENSVLWSHAGGMGYPYNAYVTPPSPHTAYLSHTVNPEWPGGFRQEAHLYRDAFAVRSHRSPIAFPTPDVYTSSPVRPAMAMAGHRHAKSAPSSTSTHVPFLPPQAQAASGPSSSDRSHQVYAAASSTPVRTPSARQGPHDSEPSPSRRSAQASASSSRAPASPSTPSGSTSQNYAFIHRSAVPATPSTGPLMHPPPNIPQCVYMPKNSLVAERVQSQPLGPAIEFKDRFGNPMPLVDLFSQLAGTLRYHDHTVVLDHSKKTGSLRLWWPEQPKSWSDHLTLLSWRQVKEVRQPWTLLELGHQIAKAVRAILEKHARDATNVGRWRIGEGGIKFENLVLVRLEHVTQGSWQPVLRLRSPSPP